MEIKPFYGTYLPSESILYKDRFNYNSNQWPVAERLQPLLMQFKTGYRNLNKAEVAINALDKTIQEIENEN